MSRTIFINVCNRCRHGHSRRTHILRIALVSVIFAEKTLPSKTCWAQFLAPPSEGRPRQPPMSPVGRTGPVYSGVGWVRSARSPPPQAHMASPISSVGCICFLLQWTHPLGPGLRHGYTAQVNAINAQATNRGFLPLRPLSIRTLE